MISPIHILNKFSISVKSVFAPKGLVGPHMTKKMWDEQFESDKWTYLGDENQREHYDKIIDLYLKYAKGRTILDIGSGQGLLYKYIASRVQLEAEQYLGIDISEVAINEAKKTYPSGNFEVLNYETEVVPHLHDVVIFNETLYYFNHAGKTMQKCMERNLAKNGYVIISMCDHERHDFIWKMIDKSYNVLEERKSINSEGISWTIKIIG